MGKDGTWGDNLSRVELMITQQGGKEETYYAPFLFFDPELREEYENKVWVLMEDWEDFKADTSIYQEDDMVYADCLYETLSEDDLIVE